MKTYILYKHTSPDGRIYVGITSQKNPKVRWQGGCGYKNNSYFSRAIQKYGWENFDHEIIFNDLTESDAKRFEKYYIRIYKSNIRKYGFNISSGGESKSGTQISEWQKQRIREGIKNKIVTDITRKKLSESQKKNWKDSRFVQHMREINLGVNNPNYGKHVTDDGKRKRGAKEITQMDMSGNVINHFISLHEAENVTGVNRANISKCCNGKYKQSGGYKWSYAILS